MRGEPCFVCGGEHYADVVLNFPRDKDPGLQLHALDSRALCKPHGDELEASKERLFGDANESEYARIFDAWAASLRLP